MKFLIAGKKKTAVCAMVDGAMVSESITLPTNSLTTTPGRALYIFQ